jgi:hypothetical protein
VLTYSAALNCSYMKVLKIYNQSEHEDWGSVQGNANGEDGLSYSMAEEDAKKVLITNLKTNLENEPSVLKKNKSAFE